MNLHGWQPRTRARSLGNNPIRPEFVLPPQLCKIGKMKVLRWFPTLLFALAAAAMAERGGYVALCRLSVLSDCCAVPAHSMLYAHSISTGRP